MQKPHWQNLILLEGKIKKMAKKMNIPPMENDINTPTKNIPPKRQANVTIEEKKKIFANICSKLGNELKYVGASDDKISSLLNSTKSSKFDMMINTLELYGKNLQKCDEIMSQINESLEVTFFNEVNDFAIRIESNYNALINYFSRLSTNEKLSFLNIDKEIVKVEEINHFIHRINRMEYFSSKQKDVLISDLQNLLETFNQNYETAKEKSFGSALISAISVIVVVYFVIKLITWILWDFLMIPLWLCYFYSIYEKYGQLKSVARSRGESGSLKLFLIAMSWGDND